LFHRVVKILKRGYTTIRGGHSHTFIIHHAQLQTAQYQLMLSV